MGPAPMIRMVEMSVRLGIKSHGQEIGHKKRARSPRVPHNRRWVRPCARVSLDQIPQLRKAFKAPINRHFGRAIALPGLRRCSSPSAPFGLRRTRFAFGYHVAAPRVAEGEAWRPGLDLNQ